MIDRYHLRYFLAIIDQGNFSKAASACNVSQPTLSVAIAKMEKTLGRPLFQRTNRRVELTEAGVALAAYARRIETSFAQAERAVAGMPAPDTVRLGLLVTTPPEWIHAFLREHAQADGRERIEIVEGRERDLIDRLTRGRIDLALTILREGGRFAQQPLFSEGYSLAMAATHPLADRAMVAGEELANEPMIVRRQCELLSETSRYFTARGVRPFFPARTMSDTRALDYVRAGLGVTVMPDGFAFPGVVRPRLEDFPYVREIGLIYASHADQDTLRDGPVVARLIRAIEAARTS